MPAKVLCRRPVRYLAAAAAALASVLQATPAAAVDLIEVFNQAKTNDPAYLAAGELHEAALEGTPQARAPLLPQLAVTGSAGRTHASLDPPGQPYAKFNTAVLQLTVTQQVYRRDLLVALRQAKTAVAQADVDFAFSEQDLMLRAAQAYFGVLNAADNLEFAEANKEAIFQQLKQAQQRFDVGLIAITGVEEAKARYDLARSTEIEAIKGVDDAWERLREITGEYHESLSALGADMPLVIPEPADIDEWTRTALEQNLQLASSNYDVVLAREQVSLTQSGHYPTLQLVGRHLMRNSGSNRGGVSSASAQDSSLTLELSMPLYQGGAVVSQTKQARAAHRAALNQFEQSRRTVQSQTRRAFHGVSSGIARVEALQQAVVSNQSALDAVEAGFQVGTRTSVDVLDAQGELFRAKFEYAASRYEYILNILSLKQAAGILSEEDLQNINGWLRARGGD